MEELLIVTASLSDSKRMLNVAFSDGSEGQFASCWLRDNAPEPHTMDFGPRNRARLLLMKDLKPLETPIEARVSNGGASVDLFWPPQGDLRASFTAQWLADRNFGLSAFRQARLAYHQWPTVTWGRDEVHNAVVSHPVEWDQLMTDDRCLRDSLSKFLKYGILLVKGVPRVHNEMVKLSKRVGYLTASHYGKADTPEIFSVLTDVDHSNLMNTPRELGLHTDLPQCELPPEIQILHFIDQAAEGGESQFSDGFRVANQLAIEQPQMFDLLTNYDVEYVDWGTDVYKFRMAARHPCIQLDEKGVPLAIHFNNQIRGWYYEAPMEKVHDILVALKTFNTYCYQPRNLLNVKMQTGDMVWFANNRVLHGRSAFKVEPGSQNKRYLEGTYMDFDVVKSRIRVLDEELGEAKHVSI